MCDNLNHHNIRAFSRLLRMQNQYFSRYLNPKSDQYLAEGLRVEWEGGGNYHRVSIHKDDAEELVRRINEHREGLGHGPVSWKTP